MITIKKNSNFDILTIDDEYKLEEHSSFAEEDIEIYPVNIIAKQNCDCCGCIFVSIIEGCDLVTGYRQIYETEVKNVVGFENCTTKDEIDKLIFQKICDLYGVAYSGDEATLHPVFLRHLKQRASDQF
jgi:hypothetical protein